MTEITCFYTDCGFNAGGICGLDEIQISGNISCMAALSSSDAKEIIDEG